MMSLRRITIAAVLAFGSVASAGLQPPPEKPILGTDTVKGCYKSKGELTQMTEIGPGDFNSSGKCNELCRAKEKVVSATSADTCYCGDKYPPKSDLVEDEKCDEPCPGTDLEACGGLDTFSVYNTGKRVSVGESEDTKSTSSSAAPTSTEGPASSSTGNCLCLS